MSSDEQEDLDSAMERFEDFARKVLEQLHRGVGVVLFVIHRRTFAAERRLYVESH